MPKPVGRRVGVNFKSVKGRTVKNGVPVNGPTAPRNGTNGAARKFVRQKRPEPKERELTREETLQNETGTKLAELRGKGFFKDPIEEKKFEELLDDLNKLVRKEITSTKEAISIVESSLSTYDVFFKRTYSQDQIMRSEELQQAVTEFYDLKKMLRSKLNAHKRVANQNLIRTFVMPEISRYAEHVIKLFSRLNPRDKRPTSKKPKPRWEM